MSANTGSVYGDILQAVVASVASVSSYPVVLRKKPIKLDGDTLPMTIVSPGKGGERLSIQTFAKGLAYDYPVLVMYLAPGNLDITTTLLPYLKDRETLRNQLFQFPLPFATATVPFDVDMDPQEAVDLQELLGSLADVTGWQMTYRVAETRKN